MDHSWSYKKTVSFKRTAPSRASLPSAVTAVDLYMLCSRPEGVETRSNFPPNRLSTINDTKHRQPRFQLVQHNCLTGKPFYQDSFQIFKNDHGASSRYFKIYRRPRDNSKIIIVRLRDILINNRRAFSSR